MEKVLISKYATVTPYEKHMHLRNWSYARRVSSKAKQNNWFVHYRLSVSSSCAFLFSRFHSPSPRSFPLLWWHRLLEEPRSPRFSSRETLTPNRVHPKKKKYLKKKKKKKKLGFLLQMRRPKNWTWVPTQTEKGKPPSLLVSKKFARLLFLIYYLLFVTKLLLFLFFFCFFSRFELSYRNGFWVVF